MYCKNCGKKLEEDWQTCPFCGSSIQQNDIFVNESEGNDIYVNEPSQKDIFVDEPSHSNVFIGEPSHNDKVGKGKKKKPIFKKIWFWILIVIVLF